jgi:hypothetical protein
LSQLEVYDETTASYRSVLYEAHLSEVFVPYMDPSELWYVQSMYMSVMTRQERRRIARCIFFLLLLVLFLFSPQINDRTLSFFLFLFQQRQTGTLKRTWTVVNTALAFS